MYIAYAISQEEDSCTLIESIQYSQPKLPMCVEHGPPALCIVKLFSEQSGRLQVLISHANYNDGQGGVDQVEYGEINTVNRVRTRPGIEQLPPKQEHCICL